MPQGNADHDRRPTTHDDRFCFLDCGRPAGRLPFFILISSSSHVFIFLFFSTSASSHTAGAMSGNRDLYVRPST